eukprot:1144234-Pelagomonas_calceolata.AAC.4
MHSHAHCTTPQHSITQCNVVAIVQLGRKSTEVTKQALQHSRTQNNVVMAAQFIYNGTTLFCSSTNGQEARKGCTTNIVDQCNTAWARGPAGACRKQGHLQRGLLAGAFHDKQLTNALKVVSARPNDVCVHVCVVCACVIMCPCALLSACNAHEEVRGARMQVQESTAGTQHAS